MFTLSNVLWFIFASVIIFLLVLYVHKRNKLRKFRDNLKKGDKGYVWVWSSEDEATINVTIRKRDNDTVIVRYNENRKDLLLARHPRLSFPRRVHCKDVYPRRKTK